MQFVDKLKGNLVKQVGNEEAREILLQKMAIKNATEDCQGVLRPLNKPTLLQLIGTCNKVGTMQHQCNMMAAAFVAMKSNFSELLCVLSARSLAPKLSKQKSHSAGHPGAASQPSMESSSCESLGTRQAVAVWPPSAIFKRGV